MLAAYAPVLDAVRALRWPARGRVAGALAGAHRARRRAPGGEFSEYRAYRQGDDPRALDWRLLARTDRAYVRLADDHALLATWIVVDASASMAEPAEKWALARAVTVGLAAVAQRAGDPVGLAAGGGRTSSGVLGGAELVRAPRARGGALAELAAALDALPPGGAGEMEPLWRHVGAGARAVVVGDFLGPDLDALVLSAGAHAAAGGEVYAVHVLAAAELDPPRGALLLEDPEDARLRRPLDGAARAEYLAAFGAWRDDVARRWRGAGAVYVAATTGEDAATAVRRVVQGAYAVPAAAGAGAR